MCGLGGIVAAVSTGNPINEIVPTDQVSAANDTAGKLTGMNCAANGIFADRHTTSLRALSSFLDLQNINTLIIVHLYHQRELQRTLPPNERYDTDTDGYDS